MENALVFAATALRLIDQAITLGRGIAEVAKIVKETNDALQKMQADKRDPSAAEWATLNLQTMALLERLNAPR